MGRIKEKYTDQKMVLSRRLANRLASQLGHRLIGRLGPRGVDGNRYGLRKRSRAAGFPTVRALAKKHVAEAFEVRA
jgi:hypothetical protein